MSNYYYNIYGNGEKIFAINFLFFYSVYFNDDNFSYSIVCNYSHTCRQITLTIIAQLQRRHSE